MDKTDSSAEFRQLMQQATSLTRGGQLMEATEALQRALGISQASLSPDRAVSRKASNHHVIDVSATEIDPPVSDAPTGGSGAAGTWASASSGVTTGSIQHGGRVLDYKLFTPTGSNTGLRPLVVMLHGCTQDPDDFAAGTQMNRLAQEHGFLVLYPAQSQSANPQRCWNWFKPNHQDRGRGEPALLAALARQVAHEHGADPDRIYVAGLSAGGAMAAVLAQTYPDVFAAAGVHSGLARGTAHDAMQALQSMSSGAGPQIAEASAHAPTIVFHGDRDGTVHPNHGNHVLQASLPVGAGRPAEETAESGRGLGYTRRIHRASDGRVVAEHWIVHGAGHAWSGGSGTGTYTDPRGPDASREMVRFFLAHGRRDHGSPTH